MCIFFSYKKNFWQHDAKDVLKKLATSLSKKDKEPVENPTESQVARNMEDLDFYDPRDLIDENEEPQKNEEEDLAVHLDKEIAE